MKKNINLLLAMGIIFFSSTSLFGADIEFSSKVKDLLENDSDVKSAGESLKEDALAAVKAIDDNIALINKETNAENVIRSIGDLRVKTAIAMLSKQMKEDLKAAADIASDLGSFEDPDDAVKVTNFTDFIKLK